MVPVGDVVMFWDCDFTLPLVEVEAKSVLGTRREGGEVSRGGTETQREREGETDFCVS